MVISGCMRASMCEVKLSQSACLRFHLGKDERGAMCWPIVICMGRWSLKKESSEVVQEQDGAREGDVAVMSGVVLRCESCFAGSVCVPLLSMIMFWLLRKV